MGRTNVELKARDADPEATAARCVRIGAEDRGVLVQRDTYFAARHGRLKLREQGEHGTELIAYRRPDGREAEESAYVLAPVSDPVSLLEALEKSLGTVVVVAKRRRLFIWKNVRVHLDDVEGLGTFLELEAVVGPGAGLAACREHVGRLRTELAIADEALISVGYSDLLLDGPQALLRVADGAMRNAYAPYSSFRVGAAVRAAGGAIYAGANVENVSYPLGACAEASALGALVAAGESKITAVAVVAEKAEVCPPCGGCRQRLAEFGGPETIVYLGRPGAEPYASTLGALLPEAFGAGEARP